MAYNITPYAVLSLLAAVVNLALGYVILSKRPDHPLNRAFSFLVLLVGVLWPFSEFMMRFTLDQNIADFWARITWTAVIFSPPLVLHLALIMVKKEIKGFYKTIMYLTYAISFLIIILNFASTRVITGAQLEYWGYTGAFGSLFPWVFIYLLSLFIYSLYLIYCRYNATANTVERIQIKYVLMGLSLPCLTGSLTQIALPALGYDAIPLASTTTIFMSTLIAYSIVRYKFMSINPTVEDDSEGEPKFKVSHKTYFVPSSDGDKAWLMYVDQILHGKQGLCVTPRDPVEVRSKYNIKKTPIIRLSGSESNHRSIPPEDLTQLSLHLQDYFKNSMRDGTVLLDGLDLLVDVNSFDEAYELIRELNALTADTKTSLIIPVESNENLQLIKLQFRKDDVEKEIKFARDMLHHGKIDEKGFRDIVEDFEKKLIELELEMSKIDEKRAGDDIEIID